MKAVYLLLGILVGLILILLIAFFSFTGIYNGQKICNEKAAAAWGDVEATLQRRLDLVPNLVETVKAYATHEEEVFASVTEMRAKVGQIDLKNVTVDEATMADFVKMQNELSGALSRLLAVAENYPDLKASGNFRDLQAQLEGTENRINVARQRYNEAVADLNGRLETFFGQMVAGYSGVKKREYFKADEQARDAPKVNFE